MDQSVVRTAWSDREVHLGGSGTCKSASHKEGKDVPHFERLVTKGNEKADELAK